MARLIAEDGVKGVTSNPAIFEKAIAGSSDYDGAIVSLTGEGLGAFEVYDSLSIEDVGMAADLFRGVWEATEGVDGYVSLEVDPRLAHDTAGTVAEARRLWEALGRPNVMVKVPATAAGVPAVRTLISEGININVTLLFSVSRYREVAEAYVGGLEARAAQGEDLRVASVASFFVSRVDTLLDPQLAEVAPALQGKVAVANSVLAYEAFLELDHSARFGALREKGAWPQRLLWASTSAKNPAYSPVVYVDSLVAPATVNTMPLETIEAYRTVGDPADRVSGAVEEAKDVLGRLAAAGFDIEAVAGELEADAVAKFVDPFAKLLGAIEAKQQSIVV